MTGNARWRSQRPSYRATNYVPDFDILVPAPELSLPIQFCRHAYKWIIFLHPRVTALEWEQECWNPVRERQLWSGDVGYVTWRSPSFVHNLYCKLMIDFSYISMFQLEDQESHNLLYPSQWVGTEKKLLLRDFKSFPLFDLFASK